MAGWPRVIKGRTDLMAAFRGYVDNIALRSANELILRQTDDGRVVVIEYEVHGIVIRTGVKYENRFCSIIKIESRKMAHWRDYLDSRSLELLSDREEVTPNLFWHGTSVTALRSMSEIRARADIRSRCGNCHE